ncbi:hypothetical protein [Aureimonas mangrovi]|uniref:hypothetical protein n=1 Tax=Aureimonas mangrovi TaxID=2758041 RepID=UPI00163D51C4|nr:hypothetical protein [Aureimonas mangrovi]
MDRPLYLVVNVDSDPDPVSEFQDDAVILAKYRRMQEILAAHTGGAAAWTVLTGPMYRRRFYEEPFIGFWRDVVEDGADLVLHPEEDLYGPGPGTAPDSTTYYHTDHMRGVIQDCVEAMTSAGLPLHAYRGGYHGFTPEIGAILKDVGISIELSCAPGIVWPQKAANWNGAPLSAYYMDPEQPARHSGHADNGALFEIPWAWDAKAPGQSRPFVVGENYIINEFSNLTAMKLVWDAVAERAATADALQIVSMVCHTYTMGREEFETRLQGILEHVRESGARFVSPMQAKAIFDDHAAEQGAPFRRAN